MKNKVSLVLEGGGMRGAYTAGCLTWLIDNNIEFDAHYGISTGALHLSSYLLKSKEMLHELSTKYIADKSFIGIRSILKTGRIVSYDTMFNEILDKKLHYDFDGLKKINKCAKIGLYDLEKGKTEYHNINEVTSNHLKAACSLPIIGKIVNINNHEYLDGGITEMIPISEAVYDGYEKHLIITTKPAGFTRKPAKGFVVWLMRVLYPECPEISSDYKVRHLNYNKQINQIKDLLNNNKAVYLYPSETVKVSRLSGDPEKLNHLFNLGYKDMEKHADEIKKLFI